MQTPPQTIAVTKRRRVVGDLAVLAEHGRDQQIFRPRVGGALVDVQVDDPATLAAAIASCVLPIPGAPIKRGVSGRSASSIEIQHASSCSQDLRLTDPTTGGVVGLGKFQSHAVDLDVRRKLGPVFLARFALYVSEVGFIRAR